MEMMGEAILGSILPPWERAPQAPVAGATEAPKVAEEGAHNRWKKEEANAAASEPQAEQKTEKEKATLQPGQGEHKEGDKIEEDGEEAGKGKGMDGEGAGKGKGKDGEGGGKGKGKGDQQTEQSPQAATASWGSWQQGGWQAGEQSSWQGGDQNSWQGGDYPTWNWKIFG